MDGRIVDDRCDVVEDEDPRKTIAVDRDGRQYDDSARQRRLRSRTESSRWRHGLPAGCEIASWMSIFTMLRPYGPLRRSFNGLFAGFYHGGLAQGRDFRYPLRMKPENGRPKKNY